MPARLIPILFVLLTLSGCSAVDELSIASSQLVEARPNVAPVVAGWRATILDHQEPAYLLDSGDRLRVFVYGQPNLSRIYPVDQSGRITVPLIGGVPARGFTTFQLERNIRMRLAAQYVRDPQVTVDVAQSRPFFILGEVRNAGQYPYVSGLTVQSAAAVAGGFSERANERIVQITRRSNGSVEKFDARSDAVVQPGDTVYVYERFF